MMVYKGYVGVAKYDDDAKILAGEVIGIRDVVTFQADSAADVEREFHASVDDYLAFCKGRGERPDKPASGKFLVRLSPEVHRQLAMLAEADGVSLNALTEAFLAAEIDQRLGEKAGRGPAKPRRSGRRLQSA